jgi:predicted ATPase
MQEQDEDLVQIISELQEVKGRGELFNPRRLTDKIEILGPGKHGAALAAAREGLEAREKTGNRQWEAELQRLGGIALSGLNRLEEAESALEEAGRIAQRQQAKAYELRAAMSLALLWGEQGRRTEARELLAPVYGWFTEGFDTADLKNAKALLDALA